MFNNFEEFLQDKFIQEYHGDKDSYESAFESWLENKDISDIIDYAEEAILKVKEENNKQK